MTKKWGHVKVGLIRGAPAAVCLDRESGVGSDGAEEIHAPLRALCASIVNVEEAKRNLDIRVPLLVRPVEASCGRELVINQVGDVETVEGSASRADLGRVIDEGREGDVVGGDFELEVGLGVLGATILWWIGQSFSLA